MTIEAHQLHQHANDVKIEQEPNLCYEQTQVDECKPDDAMSTARFASDFGNKFDNEMKSVEQHAQQHVSEKGLNEFVKEGEQAALKETKTNWTKYQFSPLCSWSRHQLSW